MKGQPAPLHAMPQSCDVQLSDIRLTVASAADARRGLFGWVSCTVGSGIRLESLAVRRTAEGRLTLSFPARRDGAGRRRFYFRPLDDRARQSMEQQVFTQLRLEEAPR